MDPLAMQANGQAPAPGGAPADPATPAADGGQGNPADPAAPGGEPPTEAFKPVYETQLPKRLQTPEIYAKLANTGGPKLENLVDTVLSAMEEKEQSKGRLYIPGKDAKPEDWEPIHAALGRPETPDGYVFDRSGELAGLPQIDGLDKQYQEIFRKHNLPASAGAGVWQDLAKVSLGLMKSMKAEREAARAKGIEEFNAKTGPDGARVRAELEQVAVGFFGKDEWEAITEARTKDGKFLGNDADFLVKLAGLRQYLTNSKTHSGSFGTAAPTTARDAVAQALN